MIGHEEYIAFHKALAESHVDLQHDDASNFAFSGINQNEFLNQVSGGKSIPLNDYVMYLLPLRGRLQPTGKYAGGAKDLTYGGFMLIGECAEADRDYRAEEAVYDKCKAIALQVVAKIHYDLQQGVEGWSHFDIGQVRYQQIGWIENSWIGYEVTYPLTESCPTTYDPHQWR